LIIDHEHLHVVVNRAIAMPVTIANLPDILAGRAAGRVTETGDEGAKTVVMRRRRPHVGVAIPQNGAIEPVPGHARMAIKLQLPSRMGERAMRRVEVILLGLFHEESWSPPQSGQRIVSGTGRP
jgi:hypothetical protein